MRPNGAVWIDHGIEAQVHLASKLQSPSTLGWRLRVEVSHTYRFETTVTLGQTIRPHGQSPLPERRFALFLG